MLRQARRFALTGVLVTGVHVALAASLIHWLQASSPLANAIAFVVATLLSYAINSLWSFSRPLHGITLARFVAVSLVGLALTVAVAGLAEVSGLSYWYGIAGVVCTVPPVTFLLHKAWTYREGESFSKGDAGVWLAALNGAALFLAISRGAILDPRKTDWLLHSGDPGTGFLAWQFFRQAPLFQLPFGANPDYGMQIGSSVVFTDSIPLLAFLFKPFTALLPATFQYFGLWILLSFVLQSVFAYKLLRRFSQDQWLALVGSAFFALAPVCIARLEGHFSLFGQWVVLAALYLYFAPRFSLLPWIILLAVSALTHFYFLTMVGVIWAAGDLWQRRWRNEISATQAAAYLSAGVLVTLAIMWLAGYFMVGRAGEGGFGIYRMNLLSMIDPDRLWSMLLRDQPSTAGDYEGFNYLGIGILLLALLAGYERLRTQSAGAIDSPSVVPLAFVSLGLSLLALSNHIAFGNVELLAYDIPDVLTLSADALRSSGRMFWPVYYLIDLAILCFVFRRFAPRMALGLCALFLSVQVADSWRALRYFSDRFVYPVGWSSPLKSPLWADIGKRYKRIVYVLPRNAPDAFLPWAMFAAHHGMALNFGYFARIDPQKLAAAIDDTGAAVLGNRLEPDSLYVFEHSTLWRFAAAARRPASDVVGVVDGFRIIAPKLKECASCDLRALADVRPATLPGIDER